MHGPAQKSLRVLLVTEAAGAGVGRHFLDLAQGLAGRGVDVACVYAPGRMDEQFAARIAAQDQYPPLFPLEMKRSVGLHDWRSARELARFIRKRGPFNLVHAHSSKAGAIVRLAVWGSKLPVVYTPHAFITLDPELGRAKRLIFGLAERILARHQPQRIIAVGQEEAEHASRLLGIRTELVNVVLNGVTPCGGPTREELRRRWQLPDDALVLGFVGRLNKQKSPLTLVRVLAALAPKHPTLRLVIVGSGPLEGEMRAQLSDLHLTDRVIWLGPADGSQQMTGFDVFCLPSLYEAMPYVVLEAMNAGIPMVCTRTGNVASVVRDPQHGRCVTPGDPPAFIQAVDELLGNFELRQQIATSICRDRGQYSVDRMVTETLQVYAELLNFPDRF